MPRCAIVSFRLGLSDGVSIVAASWARALSSFGFDVVTVAGEGPSIVSSRAGARRRARNRRPEEAVRRAGRCRSRGRREPLHDPAEPTGGARRGQNAARPTGRAPSPRPGVAASAVRRRHRAAADRPGVAARHDQRPDASRVRGARHRRHRHLQRLRSRSAARRSRQDARDPRRRRGRAAARPSRAGHPAQERSGRGPAGRAARRDVLARRSGGGRLRRRARRSARPRGAASSTDRAPATCPTCTPPPTPSPFRRRGRASAIRRSRPRCIAAPVAVGHYPVADELRAVRLRVVRPRRRPAALDRFLRAPDEALLERNRRIAVEHFSFDRMASDLRALLDDAGWLP